MHPRDEFARLSASRRTALPIAEEMLTKSWLMGVRRGWLSLLKPRIASWDDVPGAFDRLLDFVTNLEKQVTYVRPAPGITVAAFSERKEKIQAAISKLRTTLRDQKDSAQFWSNIARGIGLPSGSHEAGAPEMLRLYQTDFEAALRTHVRSKRNPKQGKYGSTRQASITELLDKVLELLRAEAAELEKSKQLDPQGTRETWAEPTYTEFDLNGMKVVVDDNTVTPSQIKEYVKHLDATYARLRQKKLGSAWYGVVFIRCQECGGVNPHGAELGVGGDYRFGPDTVNVYVRPSNFVTELMAHELGHRYWFKSMTQAQRARFAELVQTKELEVPANAPVKAVSTYGTSNSAEAFAEVFAYYVLDRDLDRDQLESFKAVLKEEHEPTMDDLLETMQRVVRKLSK